MNSRALGKNTLEVEVLNISRQGIWVFVRGAEYFLPYETYPWFRKASVDEIHNVKLVRGYRLEWPDLDVDLELKSLEHPEGYPLVYK